MPDTNTKEDFFNNQSRFENLYDVAVNAEHTPSIIEKELRDVEERYTSEEEIDKGGMKSISVVTDQKTLRKVAFARLLNSSSKNRERFISEARLTAFLEHPNIVPVYDLGIKGDEPFFTMKMIEGESLEDVIADLKIKPERYSVSDRMQIFLKICDAVAFAHHKGVIHLDLKPANIRVGKFGEVIVCDWGLSKIIQDQEDQVDEDGLDPVIYNDITMDGMIKGSPGYISPEQI